MDAFKGAFEPKNFRQYFEEALGTCVWIMLATAGGGTAWQWGVSFVVMVTFFGSSHHFNSYFTMYRMIGGDNRMNPVQGVCYLLCQFLGCFAAAKISSAIGHDADSFESLNFAAGSWKAGLQEFIMVSLFLWLYLHSQGKTEVGSMPSSLFVLFSVAICFMWSPKGCFSYARSWTSIENIKNSGANLVWGLAAVVVTNVKLFCLEGEKAFWDW